MRTREQQRIEQVAGLIAENLAFGAITAEEARQINANDGWTYEVRWDDGEYVEEGNYTRVSGDHLTAEQMDRALALAEAWAWA